MLQRGVGDLLILRATTARIRNAAKCSRNATKCVRDGAIEYVDAMKTSGAALPISFFYFKYSATSLSSYLGLRFMNSVRKAVCVAPRITRTRSSFVSGT